MKGKTKNQQTTGAQAKHNKRQTATILKEQFTPK